MIMEDHKTIWTKNEIQKARQRNLYITIGVFVVLFSVFLWLIHASYIENQQMVRDRTRKILSTYAYNLQQQLKQGEEVAEVMKGGSSSAIRDFPSTLMKWPALCITGSGG